MGKALDSGAARELALFARGVVFRYPRGWELGPVDVVARGGEVTALVGPNGAGKTTLLPLLAGLLVPEVGEVGLVGVRSRWELVRSVAWVPADPAFPVGATVQDLVRWHAAVNQLDHTSALREELAETLGGRLGRKPVELSRGQRMILALQLALWSQAQAILCDEPWSALDPVSRELLLAKLRAVAEAGKVVLVASHDLLALPRLAGRYVFLAAGRVRWSGGPEEVPRPGGSADLPSALLSLYQHVISEVAQ